MQNIKAAVEFSKHSETLLIPRESEPRCAETDSAVVLTCDLQIHEDWDMTVQQKTKVPVEVSEPIEA